MEPFGDAGADLASAMAQNAPPPQPGAMFTQPVAPPVAPVATYQPPAATYQPPPAPVAPVAPVAPPAAGGDEWRKTGHELCGRDLLRIVTDGGAPTTVRAKVVGWLDAHESDFNDDNGKPAALFHIVYTDGVLKGDEEDLEEHEVKGSLPIASDDEDDKSAAVLASLPKPSTAPLGPPKVPAPAPPPPDNHPGRLIDPREVESGPTEVQFIQTNPKRAATACHLRYEAYKDAKTVAEFFEKGGWRADLIHDVGKNYCALGGAVPTGIAPPPTKYRAPRKPALEDYEDDDDDWENAVEKDDSEDDDFAPGMKRPGESPAGPEGPAMKRRSRVKGEATDGAVKELTDGDLGVILGDDAPPAEAPPPVAAAPMPEPEPSAVPLGASTSIPSLGIPSSTTIPAPAPEGGA